MAHVCKLLSDELPRVLVEAPYVRFEVLNDLPNSFFLGDKQGIGESRERIKFLVVDAVTPHLYHHRSSFYALLYM
jgi:hypothetical protein